MRKIQYAFLLYHLFYSPFENDLLFEIIKVIIFFHLLFYVAYKRHILIKIKGVPFEES